MNYYGHKCWLIREINGDTPTRWWHAAIGGLLWTLVNFLLLWGMTA